MNTTREAILTYAENHSCFKFAELLHYLNEKAPIKKGTFSWYLRELVNEEILFKLGRGIYTTQKQSAVAYMPTLRKKVINIGKRISMAFPYINLSVLDGKSFSEFQHHLSINNAIYIEVERDGLEAVFHFLKKTRSGVYLSPSKDFVYDYIDLSKDVIILKPLISESPLIDCDGIKTPSLEKILVDVYCDEDLDYLHGSEWLYMMENAVSLYSLNRTSMLRYASRRNVKGKIEAALI